MTTPMREIHTMTSTATRRRGRQLVAMSVVLFAVLASALGLAPPAQAYVQIAGAGSTWSANAIDSWRKNVAQFGMRVDYAATGSSDGRTQFRAGTVDWAASDIPYGIKDGNNEDLPPARGFAYMPITAGGTTFMYNLKIGATRVTNLRLSGANIAKIFTGVITRWNDAAIARDNPGLTLPAIKIVPVVRSDGSGSTAQFSQWMIAQQNSIWKTYCGRAHRSPCTQTSVYPVIPGSGMVAQYGDLGVAGYVAQSQAVGSIGYVQYSYAIQAGFPVAKMLNSAGYYTEPTAGHVAVSLLKARINPNKANPKVYLTQDLSQVYVNPDPRTYPLSGYSYMILPTKSEYGVNTDKGKTLGVFGNYLLCQGQTQVDALGYSALPINLVKAGQQQLAKIPGATGTNFTISKCRNPTFSTNGTNTLAVRDPRPPACDKQGSSQCAAGTGGAQNQQTPLKPGAQGGGPSNASGGSSNGSGNGATNGSGSGAKSSGASNPGGARAGSQTTASSAPCDVDTGVCGPVAGPQDGGQNPQAQPVSTSASLGDGMKVTFMALAAVLLVGLAVGPPLISQLGNRRQNRRPPGSPNGWGS